MNKTVYKLALGAMAILAIVLIYALGPEPDSAEKFNSPKEYIEYKISKDYPDMEYDEIAVYDYRQVDNGESAEISYTVFDDGETVLRGSVKSGEDGVYF